MLIFLRRFLVLAALMFWQGGFLFYSSVVVPIGQQVLATPKDQGFITRRVTVYMNLAGAVALLPLGWDIAASTDPRRARRWLRWLSWAVMLLMLIALFGLHPRLDQHLDPEVFGIHGRAAFRTYHRWYLWISTIQWFFGVVYAALLLLAWRAEDGAHGGNHAARSDADR